MKQTSSNHQANTWSIGPYMKQRWIKLKAQAVHEYIQYICFMFASSCKHPVYWDNKQVVCFLLFIYENVLL